MFAQTVSPSTKDKHDNHSEYLSHTDELNEALKQVEASEDFKMQWIPVEADLNAIIDGGTVPETDHYSGGRNSF